MNVLWYRIRSLHLLSDCISAVGVQAGEIAAAAAAVSKQQAIKRQHHHQRHLHQG